VLVVVLVVVLLLLRACALQQAVLILSFIISRLGTEFFGSQSVEYTRSDAFPSNTAVEPLPFSVWP